MMWNNNDPHELVSWVKEVFRLVEIDHLTFLRLSSGSD